MTMYGGRRIQTRDIEKKEKRGGRAFFEGREGGAILTGGEKRNFEREKKKKEKSSLNDTIKGKKNVPYFLRERGENADL